MLSIIIPTMNRVDYLIRQLEYYKFCNVKYNIYIGDSSNKINRELLISKIDALNMENLFFIPCDDMNCCAVPNYILNNHVSTKYSIWIGDDDFLILEGLKKCVEFLEKNNDYIACHGKSFMINTYNDKPYAKINGLYEYRQPSLSDNNMYNRLNDFASSYSTPLFVVHRTDSFKKMYSTCFNKDRTFSDELLPSYIGIALGKYKEIEMLSMVRQVHQARFLLPTLFRWMTGENWLSDYSQFKNDFVKVLCDLDKNLTFSEARNFTDKMMGINLSKSYSDMSSISFKSIIKDLFFNNKYIKLLYQYFLNISNKNINKKLYTTLMTNEKYKKDFLEFKNFIER